MLVVKRVHTTWEEWQKVETAAEPKGPVPAYIPNTMEGLVAWACRYVQKRTARAAVLAPPKKKQPKNNT